MVTFPIIRGKKLQVCISFVSNLRKQGIQFSRRFFADFSNTDYSDFAHKISHTNPSNYDWTFGKSQYAWNNLGDEAVDWNKTSTFNQIDEEIPHFQVSSNKLDSKRNLPPLSKATCKNSTNKSKQFLYTGMLQLQYPLLITWPKASDCLYIITKNWHEQQLGLLNQKSQNVYQNEPYNFYSEINVTLQNYAKRLVQSMRQRLFKTKK